MALTMRLRSARPISAVFARTGLWVVQDPCTDTPFARASGSALVNTALSRSPRPMVAA